MSDLAEFLLARIAEEEARARDAKPGPWHWEGDRGYHGEWRLVVDEPRPRLSDDDWRDAALRDAHYAAWERRVVADGTACDDYGAQVAIDSGDADHIARWNPARVLAECEAKRCIVGFYRAVADGQQEHYRAGLGRALRCLALPYADHADYDKAWRP